MERADFIALSDEVCPSAQSFCTKKLTLLYVFLCIFLSCNFFKNMVYYTYREKIRKGVNQMNSVEKIVEGMKLIKEGCSEVPVGTYNCGKSTCPFGWLCYGEEIVPPEDWYIPTPWDK